MAVTITYTIQDDKAASSRFRMYLPEGLTLTEIEAYAKAYAGHLDKVVSGVIVKISLSVDVSPPATVKTTPAPESDVEEKMSISYLTDMGHTFNHKIPTFSQAYAAYNFGPVRVLDFLEDDVNNWINFMIDAAGSGYTFGAATDRRGEELLKVKRTAMVFLKSRKDAR